MAAKKSKKQKKVNAGSKSGAPVASAEVSPESATTGNAMLANIGRVALFLATVVAVYLVVTAMSQGHVAGCEEGKSCNSVLASKWAKLFGVPIGAFGLVSYVALLGLSFTRSFAAVRFFLGLSIIGGALWFTGIQAIALKTFCPWCCGTHALAVIGTVLLGLGLPRTPAVKGGALLPTGAAFAALAVTAFAQIKSPDPQPVAITTVTDVAAVTEVKVSAVTEGASGEAEKEKRQSISLHDKFELSTTELPAIGNAETADHVAVGVFDFSCVHCRQLMKVIKPVVKEYGDQLAILKMPGFYNANGRDIQKLMLPVFREAPEVYDALGEELYAEKVIAEVSVVRAELEKRLGPERLEQILAAYGGWAEERLLETKDVIETNRKITKSGKLPQLMAGKSIETGNKPNPGHYHKMFADNFGLKRENAPQIACSPDKLDLGRVIAYSSHQMKMTLSNPGEVPVSVTGIKRPQGIIIEGIPKSLEPGASQEVEIKLTIPGQQSGKVSTHFAVLSDADTPDIRVPFSANVVAIKFDPPVLNFGKMEAGGEPKVLTSKLTLEMPARITGTSSPMQSYASAPVEVIEENKVYGIKVTASFGDGIVGMKNSYATFDLEPIDDSLAWPKQIRIPIKARVTAKKKP